MKKLSIFHFLELGLSITCISTSGVLAKQIDLPAPVIIWARGIIGAIALLIILLLSHQYQKINKRDYKTIIIASILLALHWVTYFLSLKLSTVAIGMLSLFTYPLITSILEPLLLGSVFLKRHLYLAILGFVGIYFLVPELSLKNEHTIGLLLGIVSAVFYSLRNILLKRKVSSINGLQLMCYQLSAVSILLLPVLFIYPLNPFDDFIDNNWIPLLLLGLLTTAIGHTLFIRSLAHFSTTTISILSNLTPLIGILFAYIFLDEIPKGNIAIGGSIILSIAVLEGFFTIRNSSKL